MKDLRRWRFFAFCVFAVGLIFFFYFRSRSQPRFIFINETSDHRFDESIKVSILASFKRTGVQNAVVISDRLLENKTVENLSAELFQKLGLGQQTSGRALLYFYSPAQKTLKIEVGYALEGVLPDAIVFGFEKAAKSFVFSNRFQDFWAELINTLNIEIAEKEKGLISESAGFDFSKLKFLSGGAGISSVSYANSWEQLQREFKSAPLEKLQSWKAQNTATESLRVYFETLNQGIGAADLDILSTESRYFRSLTPQTSFQLYRNARMYSQAQIEKIFEISSPKNKSLAFVFFKKNHPVLPIVLKKEDQVWRVNEAISWSLFQRFEDTNRVFLKYSFQVSNEELSTYLAKNFGEPLYQLENVLTPDYFFEEPDLANMKSTLLHLYGLDRSAELLKNSQLAQLSMDELKFAADVYTNLGQYSHFLKVYRLIASSKSASPQEQKNLDFYEKFFHFSDKDWRLAL